jgi:hypothetical protein
MKISLNKKTLAALPAPIASVVADWKDRHHKRSISYDDRTTIYIQEDATYTAFNADLTATKTARAAGEWAGATGLRPSAECPLPPGCVMIEKGFFLGQPFLNIYHNNRHALLTCWRDNLLDASTQPALALTGGAK